MAFRGCEICKQKIDAVRAKALKNTRLCQEHATMLEEIDHRGEFIPAVTVESTHKPGSMKQTGGKGVTVELVRNDEAIEKLRELYEAQRSGA
jgi:hypothetical protein